MIIKIKSVEELLKLNKSNIYDLHFFAEGDMDYLCEQEYDTKGWKVSLIDEETNTFDIDGWGIEPWMYDVIEGD